MISVGILYDSQRLLRHVSDGGVVIGQLLASFKKLEVADFSIVLKICQECRWIEIDAETRLTLSASGQHIHKEVNVDLKLRHQIRDMVSLTGPSWAKNIADGRSEAIRVMPEPVLQIFREAGLLEAWNDDLIHWWDSIGLSARNRKNERNLNNGRKAERQSIHYETRRTGKPPHWKSLDTNYAHYDILSVIGPDDLRPCAIEVKGSIRKLKEATFILSRQEWDVANQNDNFRLHLWLLHDREVDHERDLRVVRSFQLASHIPSDSGAGRWLNVEVPYQACWT